MHFLTIYQYMQVCRIPFISCQTSIFAFSSSTTRLVEYKQGCLNWAFTSVIILTNPNSARLNMRLKVIGAKVWYYFWYVCLAYRPLILSPTFHSSFKLSYLPSEWIHPPIINWDTRLCFVCQLYGQVFYDSKDLRARILSNLHRIVGMLFSITNKLSTLKVDCNTLLSTILCLSHSTILRNCYCAKRSLKCKRKI